MKLYIAEKPSLGRAIAAALPSPHKKEQGFIRCGNGDVVTWCIGHLLEQVEPDAYDKKYKRWSLEDLPIIPEQWQLKPRKSASKQLTVIRKLLKDFDCLVHAGDPDREGQLLVDEVIEYCKVSKSKKDKTERLLISDLNMPAVKTALRQMRPNKEFIPLSVSALARSRADWLYGMNMTRGYTLLGQKAGYTGVLSVGRVQSPLAGLVVRRDEEIDNFIPKDFFTLDARVVYPKGAETFIRARWQPSEACEPWQDENNRVLSRKLIEHVAKRITGQAATVIRSQQKHVKQMPPLLYSLSALQIDMSKRFNMSAQHVLDACQSLYEKHKLITYPRSDSRHLPHAHYSQSHQVLDAIQRNEQTFTSMVKHADQGLKSKAWNDSKISAHHAIIPTPKTQTLSALTAHELKVYQQVARQYIMQFYPAATYTDTQLLLDIAGGSFIAKGRVLLDAGWKVLIGKEDRKEDQNKVPVLDETTELLCRDGEIKNKKTEPPKHFTEATLLQAMTGISRFVADKELQKILKETDGLGTEATRAGIIETLFKRKLLARQGKSIISTPAGRGLVHALPKASTYPDMTAHWEHQLQSMAEKQCGYLPFMGSLEQKIQAIITQVKRSGVPESLRHLPNMGQKPFKRKVTKKKVKQVQ